MGIAENLISYLSKKVIDEIIKAYGESLFLNKHEIQKHLEYQFRQISRWCTKLEFYQVSEKLDILDLTLNLTLSNSPKKLANIRRKSSFDSDTLAYLENNILLLGDPGSGKTTTLKRVCHKILNELEPRKKILKTPILFRIRKTNLNKSLYVLLSEYLGVDYYLEKKHGNYYLNKKPIETTIIRILDSINSCIFFDGLDEADISHQKSLMIEISQLSQKLENSKILVTSRSGDYNSILEGFTVYELEKLSKNQIEQVTRLWLSEKADDFLNQINLLPYYETLDRPLALINVLIIYLNKGYLPEQPSVIYKNLVELFIEKWDSDRGIYRKSKYSGFLPHQKLEFLAELSFHLLFKLNKPYITFSNNDLKRVYELIHHKYRLPRNESETVVKEIQSHNGLIVEEFENEYQFSHLTYQEYLSAIYIVRDPFTKSLFTYLSMRPAPIAVAISIASSPNNWLNSLFLSKELIDLQNDFIKDKDFSTQMIEFLNRLIIENPYLVKSGITGYVFLKICFLSNGNSRIYDKISTLIRLNQFENTIRRVLKTYDVFGHPKDNRFYILKLKRASEIANDIYAPESGVILKSFYKNYCKTQL